MAFTGNELDFYVRKYTDMIDHELQQKGSILERFVTREEAMGERTYFNRIGAVSSALHNTRFENVPISELTAERRLVSPSTIFSAKHLDELDLIRMAKSPESDVVRAITMELGRAKDDIIIQAAVGTALREVAGAGSNVTFDTTNQQVADTYITKSDLSAGSVMFHEGKLMEAIRILQTNFVDEELVVVANAKQLDYLRYRIANKLYARKDFMSKEPLMIPGLDEALDGFLGCRFIKSERVPQSSSKDQVLVFPKSAIKLGIWKDVRVDISLRRDMVGLPIQIMADESLGAVRMDEKKVVSILNATS